MKKLNKEISRKAPKLLLGFLLLFCITFLHFLPAEANTITTPKLSATQKRLALDKTYVLTMENSGEAVTWTTSDAKIVSIKTSGKNKVTLTAVGKGTAEVTGKIVGNDKSFVCKVTSYDPVKLSSSSASITKGKTKILQVTGTKKTPVWSTSNNSIVTVKATSKYKAKVTAKGIGTAYITARIGERTYRCKITVKKPPRQLKIAVAQSSGNEAAYVRNALNRLGAKATIVNENCNVKSYDGLVLPGGVDINPKLYNQKNKGSVGISDRLDKLQYKLLDKFVKAEKPVLGICRGVQMINVYFGGTLKQNIKHHRGLSHPTTIQAGSRLAKLYGTTLRVDSWHHQAADKIGKNLKVTQRAKDKTVEALEHETLPVYGVQWHPEHTTDGTPLFKDFLKLCRNNI